MAKKKVKKARAFDVFGNIAVVKLSKGTSSKEKKEIAERLLVTNKGITTVLEKVGKVKGRLRKMQTKHISGVKTKEALYTENGCVFRFNVDSTYFSPRLSNERKEVASKIRKGDSVLVMFAGVGPYPIVIGKNSKAEKIYSVEINKEASKYAKLNVELNKLKNKVEIVQRDVKLLKDKINRKMDVIVMPRPNLEYSFLKEAFSFSKSGTLIFYYTFCKEEEMKNIREFIKNEAKKAKKRVKILKIKKAGEIAPYKFRFRVDFKVL